uniref:RING-type domain-containing protein n=1 Tax=Setaria italica TaxID=4555 RepID=K3XS83_SETIT
MAVGLAVGISVPGVIAGSMRAYAYHSSLKRAWRRLRVRTLGSVTTLERNMDALEVVRTLSCNHVFHCGESDKCKDHIDKWLCNEPTMSCLVCHKTPHLVLSWKAPPPALPVPATAPALPASADQEQPESSSGMEDTAPPDLEDPPPPQSSPVSEEPLLQPWQ